MSVAPLNICLVAHFAYGAIAGGKSGHFGGVERQVSMMARWFASAGHNVSLLTWSEGNPDDEVLDGVRVIKICDQSAGIPGLRFFVPRWSGLIRAMQRADADIYYQNCAENVTGQVALWCKQNGRQFVYSLASDPDADPALPEIKDPRTRVLYRYGLKHSDRIVSQTIHQQTILKNGFGYDSQVIPMPCNGPSDQDYAPPDSAGNFRVVWVARIVPLKRLEMLLDAAEKLRDIKFEVAGQVGTKDSYTDNLLERMKSLENVTYHGIVNHDDIGNLYASANLLCCTSEYEGFPNTFLEALSHGLPILSTIDPDNIIRTNGLGDVFDDLSSLNKKLESIASDRFSWKETSGRARQYYVQNHTLDAAMKRFETIFNELQAESS